MFKYSVDTVLDEKNLTKIIEAFKTAELPRFQKLENYYRSKNEIINRQIGNDKPNNKLAHGFARYIANMATGYFMGKGIRYEIKDEDYKEKLFKIRDKNYTPNTNFELAKETSKKGISYELLYIDDNSRLRTKKLSAEEIIPVYSRSIGEFLECAIRIWAESGLDKTDITEYAEVYTTSEIWTFSKRNNRPTYE